MKKRLSGLILLFVMLVCSISLSVTYSKFLVSKNVSGEVTVYEESYCIRNGINKLSECMLVMENYSESAESAKLYIASKGDIDYQQAYPKYEYKDNSNNYVTEDVNLSYLYVSMSPSYNFNEKTGMYTLINYVRDKVSSENVGYYFCADSVSIVCSNIYKINSVSPDTSNITSITSMKYTKMKAFDEQEIGLYRAYDNQGESYYYRGEVENNYVEFAGYIWRIVRQNGDGSVRLIYYSDGTKKQTEQGKTVLDEEKSLMGIGLSSYNDRSNSPNDVGYMSAASGDVPIEGENQYYIFASSPLVLASEYETNVADKTFSLKGEIVTDTLENIRQNNNYDGYYSCLSSYGSDPKECNQLFKIDLSGIFNNNESVLVKIMTFALSSYEETLVNEESSTIKKYLETWYENNLYRKYDNYLADNVFCNDRSIDTNYAGHGYEIDQITIYKAQTRLMPTLKCEQSADTFSKTSIKGNGVLTYPIGLLTIDEARFAGLALDMINVDNYLFINNWWWLMSPAGYYTTSSRAGVFAVTSEGTFRIPDVMNTMVVRPVINLKSDIVITSGNGTAENPYLVSVSNS